MALTNAERQARARQRRQDRLTQCVTPEDVVAAIRIMHAGVARDYAGSPSPALSWDDWLAYCHSKRGRAQWAEMAPTSLDASAYWEDLPPDDLALLLKVAAVVNALREPPAADGG